MDITIDPRVVVSRLGQSPADPKDRERQALKESCQEFETLLVTEMVKAMRKSVPEGGLFDKSQATDLYTELLDVETAKAASQTSGLGIADAMYNQLADLIDRRK